MKKEEHIKYWLKSAKHDLESAESMFQSKKYDWCLFIGHLVIEKVLKAIFIDKNSSKIPPKIHNLVRLAELSKINLDEQQNFLLDTITDFNLQTRYPDYKFGFYKKCTEEYTNKYFSKIKELYKWFNSQLE
ncbi:MAG: hypothetical protein B6I31_04820 [Desulfobacteraceae bacterium 4572_19]|nr:MAG: hypothetical protein B6I31_04820 [Desulfobacteraceae bacterium 4572_19]